MPENSQKWTARLNLAGDKFEAEATEREITMRHEDGGAHTLRPGEAVELGCGHFLRFHDLLRVIKDKAAQESAGKN